MELFSYVFSQFVHYWCIMVSRRFWMEFFGSLRYRIMLSANRDILTVSAPICIPFISSY
jgi:hypothetical protein